jgi:hypothetical protein
VRIPFCQEPLDAISADGKRIAFGTLVKGTPEANRFRVTVLNEQGDTLYSRTVEERSRQIPKRVIDSTRSAMASKASTQARRDEIQRMRMPEAYPSFERMLLGRDNTLWIELYSQTGEREWMVLGSNGSPIGRVRLPRNVAIKVASRERIWGVIENEDGELGIVRYVVR